MILLGLEVLIIADIIRTIVVDQSVESVAVLGTIVLIRVVLSFSLEVEIDGMWPWNRWRIAPNKPPLGPVLSNVDSGHWVTELFTAASISHAGGYRSSPVMISNTIGAAVRDVPAQCRRTCGTRKRRGLAIVRIRAAVEDVTRAKPCAHPCDGEEGTEPYSVLNGNGLGTRGP